MPRTDEPGANAAELLAGRYESGGVLAASTLAEVRRARDVVTGRDVVIKVATRCVGATEEAFGAGVFHPNIAAPLDSGTLADGRRFVVFPFVPGITLRALLDLDGPLDPAVALLLMTEVLDALAAVHRGGVVHRDVKPENIMVSTSGSRSHAVLLDFGFAAMKERANAAVDAPRELLGTPRYAAPEQLRGDAAAPSADVYSWGLTLIECLTGRSAVSGATARDAVAEQLGSGPVAIPDDLMRTGLGCFLSRVCAKDPASRPSDAGEAFELLAKAVPRAAGGLRDIRGSVGLAVARSLTVVSARVAEDRFDEEERLHEFRAVAGLLARGGGCVISAAGSRIVAVFGLRLDQKEHVAAALDAAAELLGRPDSPALRRRPLAWSVGVHTGEALVAADGQDLQEAEVLASPVVDVAMGLDERARPGRVAVSAAVEVVARERWTTVSETEIRIRGVAEPVAVFRLRGRKGTGPVVAAGEAFVGRVAETARLREAWEAVKTGSPRVLLVRGPAGIGKSSIVRAAHAMTAGAEWHLAGCAVEGQGVPMRAIAHLARSVASSVAPLSRRCSVVEVEDVPLLAALVGEAVPEGFALPPDTPERLREKTAQAAVRLLLESASEGPTVLVIEDLHWADTSTLEFVDRLVADAAAKASSGCALPLLLLLTSRPEYAARWTGHEVEAVAQTIEVGAMNSAEVEEMVRLVAGTVAKERVASLVAVSGGVPLFVAQAMRLIASRTKESPGGVPAAIPDSIGSVLAARLALLASDALATARVASAVGIEFEEDVLRAASPLRPRVVRRGLDQLVESGLVVDGNGSGRYAFSHALVRDAAYESISADERASVHRRIAAVLERDRPAFVTSRPAELALHHELAGEFVAAANLWHRSGVTALATAAYPEAMRDLERADRLLEGLEDTPELLMRRLGLTTALGSVHIITRGFGTPEARAAFLKARLLCDALGRDIPLEVLGGIFGAALLTADEDELEAVLPRFRELAARTDNPLSSFSGHQVLAVTAWWRGRLDEAHAHASTAVELYRRETVRSVSWEFGFGIHSYAYLMVSQFHRGFPDHAEAVRLEMVERAVKQGSPHCMAPALGWSTTLTHDTGRPEETLELSSRLARISSEQHLDLWNGYAMLARGSALADLGEPEEAVASVSRGLEVMDAIGVRCGTAYYTAYLVKALLAAGDPEAALEAARRGMTVNSSVWTRLHESETIRLHGVALERLGRIDDAAAEYRRSHAMAVRDGSRSVALRALTDLVALTGRTDAASEAWQDLADALAAMTEGQGSADVRRAREVLAAAGARAA